MPVPNLHPSRLELLRRRLVGQRLWVVGLVAALGSLVAMGAGLWISAQAQQRLDEEFSQTTERLSGQLQARLNQPVFVMSGARGTLAVNGDLTRLDLRMYVESRDLKAESPGVRGVGLIKRTLREQLDTFVAVERADSAPQFSVKTLSDRAASDLYVITDVSPAASNELSRGLDIGSDPSRRAAAERAVTTGLPAMTAPLQLVQEAKARPAVLMMLPAYRSGAQPVTPQQRMDLLWGLFFAPIVIDELLADVPPRFGDVLQFTLSDQHAQGAEASLLYRSPAVEKLGRTQRVVEFVQFGRSLRLTVQASSKFEARFAQWPAGVVAGAGALLAYLVAALLYQALRAREFAETRAQALTSDLERMALVAQRTHNMVAICDADRRIIWINEGFTRLSGYSLDEARGHRPGELLECDATDAAERQRMRDAVQAGTPFHGELLNRAKDGREFWVSIEAQPLFDAEQNISGMLLIKSDISQRKQAELELAEQRQRLTHIVDGTGLGTWELHLPTGVLLINATWASMLGYELSDWDAQDGCITLDRFSALVLPEDLPPVFQALQRHLEDGAPYELEIRMSHKAGHEVWVLTRGGLVSRLADGSPERMAGTHLDISERKAIELALERERQLLRNVIEASNLGTWEWHVPSQRMRHNEQWAQLLGYRLTELGEVASTPFTPTLLHPDDQKRAHAEALRHFRGESETYELEARMRHRAGHWVWLLSRGRLLSRTAAGEPELMFGTVADISRMKNAEAELAASLDLLDRTGRIGGVGGFVYDLVSETMQWTHQTCQLHDLPAGHQPSVEEAIGYFAPEAQLALYSAISDLRERSAQFDLELPLVTAKDRRIWVRCVAQSESDTPKGRPTRLVGAIQDVTARRRSEQELRQTEELLRGAIETVDEAFVLFDANDRLVYCNEKYRKTYAASSDLIVPGARFEDIIRAGAERGQYQAAFGRIEAWVAERLALHGKGDTATVQQLDDGRWVRVIERRMPTGHIVGFRIDITQLVQAKEQAEAAAIAKGQFLANMSHEIRTPLNAVLGMMALLGRTRLDARQSDYLSKAEGAAKALLGILNDILDFSKIEAGKMGLDLHAFALDSLLGDLGVILAPAVQDKPVELLFDVGADVPLHLVGDAMRLQQILVNLGGNALKFTAEGEVVLRIALEAREANRARLRFEVQDTGIGITEAQQARLFSGFTQAEAGITRRYGGTGLGLVISQRLVVLMGGDLQLKSEIDKGSRFYFSVWLPLAEAPAAPATRSMRLLIVDDHAATREALARQAQQLGWQVGLAADGEQALREVVAAEQRGEPIEAVMVDYRMPGWDGLETARRIRQTHSGRLSPMVVMITAHGRELLAEHEAEVQMLDGLLVKPITASMMFDALVRVSTAPPLQHGAAPGVQRLLGLRLLLVEDNLINQQVATELLGAEGAALVVANNGLEAVNLLRQRAADFDLVLMDLQMPVMDGLTATRAIRGELGLLQMPVVAMTANAAASDRQACLEAGMNDHVGKPFDLDQLVAVVLRLSPRAPRPALAAAPREAQALSAAPGESPEVRAAAQAAGVALDAALGRMAGLRDVYARMLQSFVAELPSHLQDIAQEPPGDRARRLHTLKGVAATLGAEALAKTMAAAEREAADPQHPRVLEAMLALTEAQPALRRLLGALQNSPVPSAASPVTPARTEDWRSLLGPLMERLAENDAAALDELARLRKLMPPSSFSELAAAVESFDFTEALELARSWATSP